jgi:hypothetical protein
MLSKYEWFKNQSVAIQAMRENIKASDNRINEFRNTFSDTKSWDWSTKDEYSRLLTVRQGYIAQYNSIVADYNAQSSKFNWALFRGSIPRQYEEYKSDK